jgi:hypothetical protein
MKQLTNATRGMNLGHLNQSQLILTLLHSSEGQMLQRRELYIWKMKEIRDKMTSAAEDFVPNRKERSANYMLSWVAKKVISKLERYNDKAKKLFFEKFWKHRSLKPF